MAYSPNGYRSRAEECVKLANLTRDPLLSADILKLRQTYLNIADSLERILTEQDGSPSPARNG